MCDTVEIRDGDFGGIKNKKSVRINLDWCSGDDSGYLLGV
jgi:hypothetical protein